MTNALACIGAWTLIGVIVCAIFALTIGGKK
jgi:hypothetical protein